MLNNSNDEEITHLCLIANDGVKNRDTSDKDDDGTCTSDDDEEEEETGYDSLDEVYDFLNNCSRHKLLKVLLHYIKHQEGHISKVKDLKKMNFELSQENIEFQKPNDSLSNDLKSFQEKFILLEKEKDELQIKYVNLEKIVLKFSRGEENLNKIPGTQKISLTKKESVLIHLIKIHVIKDSLLNQLITKLRFLLLAIIVAK